MPPRSDRNSMDDPSFLRISWRCKHRRLQQLTTCRREQIQQTRNQSFWQRPRRKDYLRTASSSKIDRLLNSSLLLSSQISSNSPLRILIWIIEPQPQLAAHRLLRPAPSTYRLLSGVATSRTLSTFRAVFSTRSRRSSSRNRPPFNKKCSVSGQWVIRCGMSLLWTIQIWIPELTPQPAASKDKPTWQLRRRQQPQTSAV